MAHNSGDKSTTKFQYFSAFSASLCVFLVGSVWGWSSPAKTIFFGQHPPFKISKDDFATAVSLSLMGAVFSPFFGTLYINAIGRKPILLSTTILSFISWMLIYYGKNTTTLFASRFIAGLSSGIALAVAPIYIGEIASPEVRGKLSNLSILFLKIGTLFAYSIGPYITIQKNGLILAIVSLVIFIVLVWIPESHYYHLWKGHPEKSQKILQSLRSTKNITKEMEIVVQKIENQKRVKFLDCVKDPVNQKGLFLVLGAFSCQPLCGILSVIAFTSDIFIEIDDSILSPEMNNIIFGVVGVISIFVTGMVVDKLGRRILFIISTLTTSLSFTIIASYLMFKTHGLDVSEFSFIPTLALIAVPITYGIGLGPIPFIYSGELIAPNFKTFATCVVGVVTCFLGFLILLLFPLVSEKYGTGSVLYFYAIVSIFAALFALVFFPETKGLTLEQIQDIFRNEYRSVEETSPLIAEDPAATDYVYEYLQ